MSAPSAVQTPSRPKMDTKTMVSIAMLTGIAYIVMLLSCLLYTSPSPRDRQKSRMPSSA